MSVFTKLAASIFAPQDAGGTPRGVVNGEVQTWGTELERIIDAAVAAGNFLLYETKAALDADLAHDANTAALVVGDSTSNDGLYVKSGASGAGSWSRVGDVPGYSFIRATDAGGSANAIAATTALPINETQLIVLPINLTNTGTPVTVSFNGGSALTIKTAAGNDPATGGLVSGTVVAGYKDGSTFRMLSDQASAAIQAAAEAAQTAAEAARDAALAAVPAAFPADLAALAALDTSNVTTATVKDEALSVEYFLRDKSSYTDEITAADGEGYFIPSTDDVSKVWAAPLHEKIIFTELASADPTNTTWSDDALAAAFEISRVRGYLPIFIPPGQYKFQNSYANLGPIPIIGADQSTAGGPVPYRGVRLMHHSTSDFLTFDGGNVDSAGTGGRLEQVWIQKSGGFSGGRPVALVAQSDARRPGEFEFRNFLVGADGGSAWNEGPLIDGRLANAVSGKGVRTVTFDNCRVTGVLTANKYLHIRQGTHVKGQIALEQAGGAGASGVTFDDFWENVDLELRYGNVIVNHTGTPGVNIPHMNLRGLINTLDINYSSVRGTFCGTIQGGSATSVAREFRILASGTDRVAARLATTAENVTGNSVEYTVLFDTVESQENSVYDTGTGRYTAKLAGHHCVNYRVFITGMSNDETRYDLKIKRYNSSDVLQKTYTKTGQAFSANLSGHKAVDISARVLMSEGDYLICTITVNGAAQDVDLLGGSDWLTSMEAWYAP